MFTKYQTEQALNCHALMHANGSTRGVYHYLRNAQVLAEAHGRRWIMPRHRTIADDLGRSVRTIQRAIAELVERKLLVVQARFKRLRNGQWWQVSNRMRVMATVAAVATRSLVVKGRASLLAKALVWHRSDTCVAPRIAKPIPKPWQTSELYRSLMAKGIHSRPEEPGSAWSADDR